MASTQPNSLLEARNVYNALLSEKNREEDRMSVLADAVATAQENKDMAAEAVKEAKKTLTETLNGLKSATSTRREARDELEKTESEVDKTESAIEQAVKDESNGGNPSPSSEELEAALAGLKSTRATLVAEVEAATNEVEITRDILANLQTEFNELQRLSTDANTEYTRAKRAASDNSSGIRALSTKLNAAETEIEGFQINPADLEPAWEKVRGNAAWHSPPVYLLLKKAQRDIDPIAESILLKMKKKYSNQEHLDILKRLIQKNGIATECMKVTARENKKIMTMPYAAVCILDATYYKSLRKVIESAGPDVQTVFEDTVGVVEAIRLEQQDQDNGPIKEFALEVVDRVATTKQWQLSDQAIDMIASRIHQSLLYR